MTLSDAISRAIQAIACMAAGVALVVAFGLWIAWELPEAFESAVPTFGPDGFAEVMK
jgi:hypothetical protein